MSGFRSLASACCLALIGLPAISAPLPLQSAEVQQDVYIIGPGDVLALTLFDAAELSGELTVMNDGTVPLPLVGSVRLSGLTLQQATNLVEQSMGAELLRPDLQLRVEAPRPIRVALVGQ